MEQASGVRTRTPTSPHSTLAIGNERRPAVSSRSNSASNSNSASGGSVGTGARQSPTVSDAVASEFRDPQCGSEMRQLSTGDWHDVGQDEIESPGMIAETLAHRLHRTFTYTALPTGVIIALFLLGLLLQAKMEAHIVGRAIAGYCAIMSIIMTSLLVYLHLSAYTDPLQQRRIVRILLMVPIYAVDSCLALWNYEMAPLIGLARDCYEAYVIWTFYHLLCGYLGGEEAACNAKAGTKMSHLFPLCCLPPFQLSQQTFRLWKLMLVQYMVLKPVLAVVAIVLMLHGVYDESSWSFRNTHVYFVLIQNVMVTLAFTSLMYFFVEYKVALARFHPLGKFAAVKAVVFLSFWQSVLLGLLVHFGVISGSREGLWTRDEVSTGVQDFLITLEMLAMCYVHHHVFSEEPYVPLTGHRPVRCWHLLHVFSVRDVLVDTIDTVTDIAAVASPATEGAKEV